MYYNKYININVPAMQFTAGTFVNMNVKNNELIIITISNIANKKKKKMFLSNQNLNME